MKKLHAQKIILERDINKQGQISERRRDSVVDRRSSIFDPKRPKGLSISFDQIMQVNESCFILKFLKRFEFFLPSFPYNYSVTAFISINALCGHNALNPG